jgi:hypothetical protein
LANFRVDARRFDPSKRLEALSDSDLLNGMVLLIIYDLVKLLDREKVPLAAKVRLSFNSKLFANLPDKVIRAVDPKPFVFVR